MRIIKRIYEAFNAHILGVGRARYHQIFDDYKIIFIHVPKTAGISVLESFFGRGFRVGHAKAIEYKRLDDKKFQSYFKFAFVRNPWDRLVSCYTFLKNGGLTPSDQNWVAKNKVIFQSFDVFVRCIYNDPRFLKWKHLRPQSEFVCDKEGNVIVDYIGRFENIPEAHNELKEKLGFGNDLLTINQSPRKTSYRDYYTDETRVMAEKIYQKDIEKFNYSFGDND